MPKRRTLRVWLALKRDGPGQRPPPGVVRDHSGPFQAIWPRFGLFWGGTPFGVANATTHPREVPGPKLGYEKGTIGVTHLQSLGPEPEPTPELRTTRICEVLAGCLFGEGCSKHHCRPHQHMFLTFFLGSLTVFSCSFSKKITCIRYSWQLTDQGSWCCNRSRIRPDKTYAQHASRVFIFPLFQPACL